MLECFFCSEYMAARALVRQPKTAVFLQKLLNPSERQGVNYGAETKASSLIRLIKNPSKILKSLQLKKNQPINSRHRIQYIFDNKAKNKIFNIS